MEITSKVLMVAATLPSSSIIHIPPVTRSMPHSGIDGGRALEVPVQVVLLMQIPVCGTNNTHIARMTCANASTNHFHHGLHHWEVLHPAKLVAHCWQHLSLGLLWGCGRHCRAQVWDTHLQRDACRVSMQSVWYKGLWGCLWPCWHASVCNLVRLPSLLPCCQHQPCLCLSQVAHLMMLHLSQVTHSLLISGWDLTIFQSLTTPS